VANRARVKVQREDSANERSVGNRLAKFRTNLAEEMAALPDNVNRVIFSDERLSLLLKKTSEIEAVKKLLSPYFDKFTIVVYLRSQDSYLGSRYSELLRAGTLSGPDNEVATEPRLRHHDYRALIDRWAEVFGEDSIKPRLYERGTNRAFDSVADFLSVCGLDIDVSADDPARSRNQSMSFAGQQILLRVGALIAKGNGDHNIRGDAWRQVSVTVSKALPGQGWLPTRDEAAAFMQRFAEGNEAIRQRYFPERVSLFADESARFPLLPMQATDGELVEAACQAFLESVVRGLAREKAAEQRGASGTKSRDSRGDEWEDDGEEDEDDDH
jgi:hypothetical protein